MLLNDVVLLHTGSLLINDDVFDGVQTFTVGFQIQHFSATLGT